MQSLFYVSHAGQNYGPWTIEEITQRIAQMELIATDYIFDEKVNGWVPLFEHETVLSALRAQKPSAPPAPSAQPKKTEKAATPKLAVVDMTHADASSGDAEWFIQKETHRYGPFTYYGLIKALQEKSIYDFDLVWRNGMDQWIRIAEHEMFTPEAIRKVKQSDLPETSKFFFERQFPRFKVESEVIVHDNHAVWLGQTYQGSEGGSGLMIKNAYLVPGQVLFMHFTGFEGVPSFNALCEVVNKRYVANVVDARTAIPYGVKFVKIDSHVQKAMKDCFSARIAA